MNGDKNKPLDSNQLHQGNSIEVSVRKKTDPIAEKHQADTASDDSAVNINVANHSPSHTAEPVELHTVEATHVESAAEPVASYKPEIDIAEELKIEESLEPVVPPVTEPAATAVNQADSSSSKPSHEPSDSKPNTKDKSANTPGMLVLQWLTYAFWGWTGITMIWLSYIVLDHLIGDNRASSGMSAYMLAAVLVLLPLSIGCDWFYSRKEPSKKTGASMILMILHAVLFALLAIGSLIIFMYALVQYMLVPPNDLSDVYVMMATSASVAIIFLVVFLRTLNPLPKKKLGLMLSIFMFIAVTALVAISLTGPIKTQKAIQQDNQTTEQLMTLVNDLNQHAEVNHSLPENLSSSNFAGKNNPLVVNGDVEYTKYKQSSGVASIEPGDDLPDFKDRNRISDNDEADSNKISYKLCVNYKVDTSGDYTDPLTVAQPSDMFYATEDHKAGKNCYELYTLVSASH